jgi:hypothetical protein
VRFLESSMCPHYRRSCVLPYVAADHEHLVSFRRRERRPELSHGLAAVRDWTWGVKAPTFGRF